MHIGCDVVISFPFAPLLVTTALNRLIAHPYGAACNSAVQVIFARWQSGRVGRALLLLHLFQPTVWTLCTLPSRAVRSTTFKSPNRVKVKAVVRLGSKPGAKNALIMLQRAHGWTSERFFFLCLFFPFRSHKSSRSCSIPPPPASLLHLLALNGNHGNRQL